MNSSQLSSALNEPLKSLLARFADGADLGRSLSAAEIAADNTPPDGIGELLARQSGLCS